MTTTPINPLSLMATAPLTQTTPPVPCRRVATASASRASWAPRSSTGGAPGSAADRGAGRPDAPAVAYDSGVVVSSSTSVASATNR